MGNSDTTHHKPQPLEVKGWTVSSVTPDSPDWLFDLLHGGIFKSFYPAISLQEPKVELCIGDEIQLKECHAIFLGVDIHDRAGDAYTMIVAWHEDGDQHKGRPGRPAGLPRELTSLSVHVAKEKVSYYFYLFLLIDKALVGQASSDSISEHFKREDLEGAD